jgi:hypothetical protein
MCVYEIDLSSMFHLPLVCARSLSFVVHGFVSFSEFPITMRGQQQIQILVNQGSDVLDFSFDERGSLHFRFDRQEIGHFGFSSGLDVDCCNERQQVLLAEFFLLLVGICLVFYTRLFLPLKRLCSFFHEFGQALAVWLVCGKVRMIDLQGKHGGETIFEGVGKTGLCVVHPAGYFASAAWAIALIVASGGEGLMSQLLAFVTAGVIFLCFSTHFEKMFYSSSTSISNF